MATFLSKLFKPKWQSKHLETRKHAVENLNALDASEHTILIQIAEQDASPLVQEVAILKINDTDALIKLHKTAQDSIKPHLENRLYSLASSQSLSIFDLVLDLELLTDMIIKSTQAESFIRGLARIESAPILLKIASQSRNAQIRQAAAELIETELELNQLFSLAKNKDKTVYHIAKTKLANLRALAQQETHNQAILNKLLKDMESLSQTEALQHFEARLAHIEKQWNELNAHASEEQATRFSNLSERCQQRIQSVNLASAEAETKEEQTQEAQEEVDATLSTLTDTLTRFKQQAAKPQDISALDALIKTQENRWLEATQDADVGKRKQKDYADIMLQLRDYLKALKQLKEVQTELTDLTEALNQATAESPKQLEQNRKSLSALIKKVEWPTQFMQPEALTLAEAALNHSAELKQDLLEQQKKVEKNIHTSIEKLDRALEEKQIKEASALLKNIQQNMAQLDSRHADRFQAGLALRINQLNELRDWQGFANTPKQEELCEIMERLAETHIDPTDKADKIKQLQQEWKALGGSGNQELWNRFKAASDKAFEPCALFFNEQNQLKQVNLEKRKTLVEQLREYTQNVDWTKASSKQINPIWTNSDWKTADKINRQARQEWKDAFPIDFKANKEVQNEFNALMSTFDDHLEQEKQHNEQLKRAIVEQAKQLIAQENIDQSVQDVKLLQDNWQKIGITHHKVDRQLWNEFREVCDAIFAARNAQRDAKRSEIDEAVQQANEQVAILESNCKDLTTKDAESLNALLIEQKKAAQNLPELPSKVREKLLQRIDALSKQINSALNAKESEKLQSVWQEIARKAALMNQFYQTRIRSADSISESAIADFSDKFTSRIELPDELENSLKHVSETLISGDISALTPLSEEQMREHCIRAEIVAGVNSPESDKALRMQLQVGRLSEGFGSANNTDSTKSELQHLLTSWYLSLLNSSESAKTYNSRIEAARQSLFS